MSENIILTTGVYDVIKDHLRRKKVTIEEENRLLAELKNAQQVRRRELPPEVVTVNRKVTIKDHTLDREEELIFVGVAEAKPKKNKFSILSDMALATVGYKVGDVIEWPFRDGERKIEILKVENWQN
ncbi:GreA/GreB family elongation factor [Kaistella sp. PBT33-4]|uniref:GreA/GreB family elongation factor n=1 Tax=Kaistella sp. PBT33-4 TaxID=3032000 RepID=UPI0023D8B039|nr:GreA/GreB family elongation factor [Kaistella sp. PBT33-4]MDF0718560.1 GreA/GreB family elongation factor [Kaistella sp. PBT33-4]